MYATDRFQYKLLTLTNKIYDDFFLHYVVCLLLLFIVVANGNVVVVKNQVKKIDNILRWQNFNVKKNQQKTREKEITFHTHTHIHNN